MISYAQNGEDVILSRAFRDVERGFYVDIGACHPDNMSVTKHFYDLGWSGVNVEPDPALHALFVASRPRDANVCAAVGLKRRRVEFFPGAVLGHGTIRPPVDGTDVPIPIFAPCMPLRDVFDLYAGDRSVEFLKVDAEGSELEIVKSGDWKRHRPRIVVLEAITPQGEPNYAAFENILAANGYRFALFDGLNRFYCRSEDENVLLPVIQAPANIFDAWRKDYDIDNERKVIRLESDLATIERRLAETTEAAEAHRGRADGAEHSVSALTQKIARLAGERDETLAAAETQNRQSEAAVHALNERVRTEEAARAAAEAELQAAEGQLAELHEQAGAERIRAENAEGAIAALRDEMAALDEDRDRHVAELHALHQQRGVEVDALTARAKAAEAAAAQAAVDAACLLAAAENEIGNLRHHSAAQTSRAEDAERAIAVLSEEMAALGEDRDRRVEELRAFGRQKSADVESLTARAQAAEAKAARLEADSRLQASVAAERIGDLRELAAAQRSRADEIERVTVKLRAEMAGLCEDRDRRLLAAEADAARLNGLLVSASEEAERMRNTERVLQERLANAAEELRRLGREVRLLRASQSLTDIQLKNMRATVNGLLDDPIARAAGELERGLIVLRTDGPLSALEQIRARLSNVWLPWSRRRRTKEILRLRREIIEASGYFDAEWYRAKNCDVAASGMKPVDHFNVHGSLEGRRPSEAFDGDEYVKQAPQAKAEHAESFMHFLFHCHASSGGGHEVGQSPPRRDSALAPVNAAPPAYSSQAAAANIARPEADQNATGQAEISGFSGLLAGLYAEILGRTPGAAEFDFWRTIFETQGPRALIDGLATSDEATNVASTRPAIVAERSRPLVALLYEELLLRTPTPSESSYWSGQMKTQGPIRAITAIAASDEAVNAWRGRFEQGISPSARAAARSEPKEDIAGTAPASIEPEAILLVDKLEVPALKALIVSLYRDVLFRTPEAQETQHWTNVVRAQGISTFVEHIVTSTEASNKKEDRKRAAYLKMTASLRRDEAERRLLPVISDIVAQHCPDVAVHLDASVLALLPKPLQDALLNPAAPIRVEPNVSAPEPWSIAVCHARALPAVLARNVAYVILLDEKPDWAAGADLDRTARLEASRVALGRGLVGDCELGRVFFLYASRDFPRASAVPAVIAAHWPDLHSDLEQLARSAVLHVVLCHFFSRHSAYATMLLAELDQRLGTSCLREFQSAHLG